MCYLVIKSVILGHFYQIVLPNVIFWCFCVVCIGAIIDNVVCVCAFLVPNKKPANPLKIGGFYFFACKNGFCGLDYWLNRNSISAFCPCIRFSASSQTTASGESRISAETSLPRYAGRQCINNASALARLIKSLLT